MHLPQPAGEVYPAVVRVAGRVQDAHLDNAPLGAGAEGRAGVLREGPRNRGKIPR